MKGYWSSRVPVTVVWVAFLIGIALGWYIAQPADAAPLSAHSRPVSPQIVSVTVRLDLAVKRRQCVFVYTNSGPTYGLSAGYLWHKACLHKGRNRVRFAMLAASYHRAWPLEPGYNRFRAVQPYVMDPCVNVVRVGVRRHSKRGKPIGELTAFERSWRGAYACG